MCAFKTLVLGSIKFNKLIVCVDLKQGCQIYFLLKGQI